jgi:hypothetical protein
MITSQHRATNRDSNPKNDLGMAVGPALGVTQEGVLREAVAFPDERRDDVVYGLLASE